MKCKVQNCNTQIHRDSVSATLHGGVCKRCFRLAIQATWEGALDAQPSYRTREQWEALRDGYADKIKCRLAQGADVHTLAGLHKQAVEALASLPVTICPHELARLQHRDSELAEIESVVSVCLNPHHNHSGASTTAGRLLHWLKNSNVLMGRRF